MALAGHILEDRNTYCDIIQICTCIVVCVVIRVTLTGSPTGWQGAERVSGAKWTASARQTVTAWLASRHQTSSGTYSFPPPPPPKKFLHSFLGCLKSSWSRFKSFYFFSPKITTFGRFRPNVAFWSMFWFKPFRNFLRKITILRNFDQWSEILSVSAGRPLGQGVCPSLNRGERG